MSQSTNTNSLDIELKNKMLLQIQIIYIIVELTSLPPRQAIKWNLLLSKLLYVPLAISTLFFILICTNNPLN